MVAVQGITWVVRKIFCSMRIVVRSMYLRNKGLGFKIRDLEDLGCLGEDSRVLKD